MKRKDRLTVFGVFAAGFLAWVGVGSQLTGPIIGPAAPALGNPYDPSRLLRVAFESGHHRQCPLSALRVHAGTTLSILAVEREHLITSVSCAHHRYCLVM